jgi:hypothetical protein
LIDPPEASFHTSHEVFDFMNSIQIDKRSMLRWIAGLCALAAFWITWRTVNHSVNEPQPARKTISRPADSSGGEMVNQKVKARLRPGAGNTVYKKLEADLAAGELGAVHEELARLADARQLSEVATTLRTWCRDGSLEVVQWCLDLSAESDPELHLALCVETLSNSSDVMREIAKSELETTSGIRFDDPAQARSWLSSRPQPRQ